MRWTKFERVHAPQRAPLNLVVLVALYGFVNFGCTSPAASHPDSQQPSIANALSTLRDVRGQQQVHPLLATDLTQVLIFTTHDCPIANSYTPTLLRLMQRWQPRGVHFSLFYLGSDLATARKHHADHEFHCTAFVESDLRWVRQMGITRTPECIVMQSGEVRYRGRIDDTYRDLGERANRATRADLHLAIEEVLAGEAVTLPTTEAVGCPIPWQPETAPRVSPHPTESRRS